MLIPVTRTKRAGLSHDGTLAQRYVRAFDGKWVRGGACDADELLAIIF